MIVETIYMPLLNEGADVWAPIKAENRNDGTFLVLGPMPIDQKWAFEPGALVKVRHKRFSDGQDALVAFEISN